MRILISLILSLIVIMGSVIFLIDSLLPTAKKVFLMDFVTKYDDYIILILVLIPLLYFFVKALASTFLSGKVQEKKKILENTNSNDIRKIATIKSLSGLAKRIESEGITSTTSQEYRRLNRIFENIIARAEKKHSGGGEESSSLG